MVELWTCCRCLNITNVDLAIDRCPICGHSKCYTCLFPGEPRPSAARTRAIPIISPASSDDASSDSMSDRDSVFSYGYSQTSQSTIGSTDMQDSLVDEIVRIICVNDFLSPLYQEASRSARNGSSRLQNNVRRLLVKYAYDMKREPGSNLREYQAIAQFVGRFAGRISSEICGLVSRGRREYFGRLKNLPASKRGHVESLLRILSNPKESSDGVTRNEPLDSDDEVSEPEDDDYEYNDDTAFPEISRAERFLLRGAAFRSLIARLNEWVYPSFHVRVRKLLDLVPKPDGQEANLRLRHELFQLVAEIRYIPPNEISFSKQERMGGLNYLQGLIQGWSGQTWDWRPLKPYMRPLSDGETRILWTCVGSQTTIKTRS